MLSLAEVIKASKTQSRGKRVNNVEQSKINYFENARTTQHREFIISQNNCVLCGTVLELKHLPEDETQVKEEAYCPHCDVKTRGKIYSLN